MGLVWDRQVLVMDRDGTPALARIAECGECRGTEFLLLVITGRDGGEHQHVQCRNCGTSYGDNTCGRER